MDSMLSGHYRGLPNFGVVTEQREENEAHDLNLHLKMIITIENLYSNILSSVDY